MDRKRKMSDDVADGPSGKCKRSASSSPPHMPERSLAQGGVEVTIDGCVIKGYHFYRRKPLLDFRMSVVPEPNNPMDKDALLVVMPPLTDIPVQHHNAVVDNKRGVTVRDIAGQIIGRVPAGLATILARMTKDGELTGLTCVATGPAQKSYLPWPEASSKGGGVVVPCKLHLQVTSRETAVEMLRAGFESDLGPEKDALTIL
ncbi:uncharacterized protein LOC144868170 [Branchiostoma floridae x Branchiostoma japonicum]